MFLQIFNLALIWIFFGFLTAHLARRRGKNPGLWFWLGLLFGLFAILFVYLIPNPKPQKKRPPPAPLAPPPPPPPKEKWFYFDSQKNQIGPLFFNDLIAAWEKKELSEESYIWTAGLGDWKKVAELPEILRKFRESQPLIKLISHD